MFSDEVMNSELQASVDAIIVSVRGGRQPNDCDMERLALAWANNPSAEWEADLVGLWDLRAAYEDGWFDPSPVETSSLTDADLIALVRQITPLGLSQHDPDSIRMYWQAITHTDGDDWIVASFYALELVPIGIFRSLTDAKTACINRGYLVGNDGEDTHHLNSMSDDLILRFFRTETE
jgi:hypothetical protein